MELSELKSADVLSTLHEVLIINSPATLRWEKTLFPPLVENKEIQFIERNCVYYYNGGQTCSSNCKNMVS